MDPIKSTYRQPCNWSRFSQWTTVIVMALFAGLSFIHTDAAGAPREWALEILRWAFLLILLSGLYYCPKYVEVTPSRLIISRLLTKKYIPMSDVVSVEPYQRTMNFMRLCGSGGVFGFWGWFRNQELGRFFVYATSLKQLVLVTLASGRRYVVSCENAQEMAAQIAMRMKR